MNQNKPWFWPDTQGFLAIAIITVMSAVIFVMLFHPTTMDDRSQGDRGRVRTRDTGRTR